MNSWKVEKLDLERRQHVFQGNAARPADADGMHSSALQIIDVEAGYLQNVIEYDEQNAFIVNSDIEVQGKRRIGFNFVGAQLKLRGNLYKIPPFGKGWCVANSLFESCSK